MAIPILTEDRFEAEAAGSTLPVLLDFYASWCGPCQAIAPTLEALAEKHSDHYRFFKVDVDAERSLAKRFDIMSIPTLVLLKGGREINRLSGARSAAEILHMLEET